MDYLRVMVMVITMTIIIIIVIRSSSSSNIISNRINNIIIIIIIVINPIGITGGPLGTCQKKRSKDWTTMATQDRTDQQRRT